MWDDYHPYVYETTDYGAHWTTLTNGLPADQYVFVVRQDPREPRLLFAGTRSTVYVSLDGGAQWQPLTLNLPGVQVRDLAIDTREGELVAATHGRAFWILDNLAFLEQLARQTVLSRREPAALRARDGVAHATPMAAPTFSIPNFGENPKYGAAVFFNLPPTYNGKTPLTLSFLDAQRRDRSQLYAASRRTNARTKLTPRTRGEISSADEQRSASTRQAHRGRTRHESLSMGPALRARLRRRRASVRVPTDDLPDTADGPTIVPGTYTVVLQYGSQTLDALRSPCRSIRASILRRAISRRDYALELQIRNAIDRLDRSIAAAMSARSKLSRRNAAAGRREIADLVLLDVHSSEADVMHPTKVREQLGFLLNSLEGAYDRPTAAEYAAVKDLEALATAGEARLRALTQE